MGFFGVFLMSSMAGLAAAHVGGHGHGMMMCHEGDLACKRAGWTIYMDDYDHVTHDSDCTMEMAGCTGELIDTSTHMINGTIVVKDDCTFAVTGWQFDGLGPAPEWWAAMQDMEPLVFPYPANAMKIAKLGEEGAFPVGTLHGGKPSDIMVRLGKNMTNGDQYVLNKKYNHISVWCEEFKIDFGNAALVCPEKPKMTSL